MSLHAKTLLNLLAGALAGLLAWALTDATGWYGRTFHGGDFVGLGLPGYGLYLLYGATFGLILGLLLGLVDALSLDSPRHITLTLALGALFGFVGGGLGLHLGQTVYGWLSGGAGGPANESPGHFLGDLFARAVGWGLIGAMIGAAQGAGRRSAPLARQGAFGGLLGGLLGGTVFQIASVLLNSDVPARLAALAAVGALTGFGIGLVQDLLKQAWIKVLVGCNEGKEYLIAKPIITVGRSELSDVGLFGDTNIAPTHVVIEALPGQGRHRMRHVAGGRGDHAYPPTLVNGRAVTAEQWLADGDTLQIGARTLLFQEKATRGVGHAAPPLALAWRQVGGGEAIPDTALATPKTGTLPARPPLAAPPDVVAQMGTAPPASEISAPDGPTSAFAMIDAGRIGTRLTAISGPYSGQSFQLSHQPVTLGRSSDREIALPADSSVSRAHARIAYESGRHVLSDDGSANGTLVNGVSISEPRRLRVGDTLKIGETALRYE